MENSQKPVKIKETIIVEGKYDKIRLASLFDANIIELGGFQIYNNKDKLNLIRRIAAATGIILVTDSDSSGFKLRHFIEGAVPKSQIKNVFIPNVSGKEKRKQKPGKEGLIGVEGMTTETLLAAFKAAGVDPETGESQRAEPITKAKLFELGLSGKENSAELRRKICEHYGLPKLLSANALGEILPIITNEEELCSVIDELKD